MTPEIRKMKGELSAQFNMPKAKRDQKAIGELHEAIAKAKRSEPRIRNVSVTTMSPNNYMAKKEKTLNRRGKTLDYKPKWNTANRKLVRKNRETAARNAKI